MRRNLNREYRYTYEMYFDLMYGILYSFQRIRFNLNIEIETQVKTS
jgi:hypothetical protein